jgi:hypothetical protein
MSLEEHTIEDNLERTCQVCGTKLSETEIEASRDRGGPFLCLVHAEEEDSAAAPGEGVTDDPGE